MEPEIKYMKEPFYLLAFGTGIAMAAGQSGRGLLSLNWRETRGEDWHLALAEDLE